LRFLTQTTRSPADRMLWLKRLSRAYKIKKIYRTTFDEYDIMILSNPKAPDIIYCAIQKQPKLPKSETETIYAVVSKPPEEYWSVAKYDKIDLSIKSVIMCSGSLCSSQLQHIRQSASYNLWCLNIWMWKFCLLLNK